MNKSATEISKKYSHIGQHVLLTPNTFAVFGNGINDDMVLIGKCKFKSNTLINNNEVIDIDDKDLNFLESKVNSLTYSSAYASFQLTEDAMKTIKNCIKKIDATHLRIHDIENSIRVSIFDLRKFLDNSRIQRRNTQKIRYYDSDNANIGSSFTSTVNAFSFMKLPAQDTSIRINKNGICEFEPLKDDVKYLLRDQEIIEPNTVFFSDRLDCQISFSFHPKT
jgi:hypothetical protein